MSAVVPFGTDLPASAAPAAEIVRKLTEAGHRALLAGGCVRDLLSGAEPSDYDIATDATPEKVCELFHPTRKVGAQFGVVLVRVSGCWLEVATFRTDGEYLDGRHPRTVNYGTAELDARRRDFTINGMFLDPVRREVIDYVGGRADQRDRRVRAIGDPAARFAEDHLRLLRAVRFAARLEFEIEPRTLEAIRKHAPDLERIVPERVREELEKILPHASRRDAFRMMRDTGLLTHLWRSGSWSEDSIRQVDETLAHLVGSTSFALVFAVLVGARPAAEIKEIARELAFSNQQRDTVLWLAKHQGDFDDPMSLSLSDLKRRLANPAFTDLRVWVAARHAMMRDGSERAARLSERIEAISVREIAPTPLVRGEDLLARKVARGPVYKELLDELYARQLEETLADRETALAALDELIAERRGNRGDGRIDPSE